MLITHKEKKAIRVFYVRFFHFSFGATISRKKSRVVPLYMVFLFCFCLYNWQKSFSKKKTKNAFKFSVSNRREVSLVRVSTYGKFSFSKMSKRCSGRFVDFSFSYFVLSKVVLSLNWFLLLWSVIFFTKRKIILFYVMIFSICFAIFLLDFLVDFLEYFFMGFFIDVQCVHLNLR